MRAITQRDKRTIQIAAIGLATYLVIFYGWRGSQNLETRRTQYRQLLVEAQSLKLEMLQYETRFLQKEKLKANFRIDPPKLARMSLVGEASEAIQKAAQSGGIQLGPMRESPGSAAAKELATMQMEGTGPITAITALLHRIETLGFPLVVDSIQIDPDSKRPGNVKLTLHLIVLDYDQWKKAVPQQKPA